MLISASRRTDIPAYYSEWFLRRIKEGFAYVRNPMNAAQISKISLAPDVVDGIVLWTKNPVPMLNRLCELAKYPYYFQFTLNPYGAEAEPNIPSKRDVLVPAFMRLADMLGAERVIWRYDPIILSERYTPEYHIKYFELLAKRLSGYTRQCTISFLDAYKSAARGLSRLRALPVSEDAMLSLARAISDIAGAYGLRLAACAEPIDLSALGIARASCVDKALFERIGGCGLNIRKDKNQRAECGCAESIDIGAYNTCIGGCLYCYAGGCTQAAARNHSLNDPASPLLTGSVKDGERVTVRDMPSRRA